MEAQDANEHSPPNLSTTTRLAHVKSHLLHPLSLAKSRFLKTYLPAKHRFLKPATRLHNRIPYLRGIPLPAVLIILFLALVNIVVWIICAIILLTRQPRLISTAAITYTLGLRHALDADHISAIDLMTRRLIASGQRPVTVGTFFSLGHSTIVLITCIVVAATAAAVSDHFNGISVVGGIIGSSVSAAFLILLGLMNVYIFYRLLKQLRKVLHAPREQSETVGWQIDGGGPLFRLLKKIFKLIDRPWKMYPVGVIFGLGFDTSSEVALLGISSIEASEGTNIWLILIFPVLFASGMCLIDTIDGALMMSLYVKPMELFGESKSDEIQIKEGEVLADPPSETEPLRDADPDRIAVVQEADCSPSEERTTSNPTPGQQSAADKAQRRAKDPVAFLYYSTVLTGLTVIVALVIGTIQLLTMVFSVTYPDGKTKNPFWKGIERAGANWETIGGAICGSFIIVGLASVVAYKPWRRWAEARRDERFRLEDLARGRDVEGEGVVVVELEDVSKSERRLEIENK